jgi:hydrogenase maturation protease
VRAAAGEGVLVVGWGNPLRGDDGLGWHAATRLVEDRRLAGATVLCRHQLTPELAEDVARTGSLVVLVDAGVDGGPPGTVTVTPVEPDTAGPPLSHHLDPGALAALSVQLYGRVPPMVLVRVAAASFEPGEGLSPALEAALPAVLKAVAGLAAGSAHA